MKCYNICYISLAVMRCETKKSTNTRDAFRTCNQGGTTRC